MARVQGVNSNGELLSSAYVVHARCEVGPFLDGVTRQEFADECDINVLMARYERTGVLNHFNSKSPQFLDVTDVPDLQASLHYMEAAKAAFMSLPAVVRREFDNDPVQFVDFAADPSNVSKMREWGLAAPEKPVQSAERSEGVAPQGNPDSPSSASP